MASTDTIKLLNQSIFGDSDPSLVPEKSAPGLPPEPDPLAVQNPNEGRELIEEMMGEQGEVRGDEGLVKLPGSGAPTTDLFTRADAALIPLETAEVTSGTAGDSTPLPKKTGYELALVATPDWLPAGWTTEIKVRSSGATAGTRDRYFYDPVSNRKFRSKKEVFNFLQTGKLGRYKPKQKTDESYAKTEKSTTPLNSSNPEKPASSGSRRQRPLRFDFLNPPPKVRWVFNGSEGSWSPFIGNEELPESSRRSWVTALELHTDVLNSFQE